MECQYDDPPSELSQFLSLHLIYLTVLGRAKNRCDLREEENLASCKRREKRENLPSPPSGLWKKNVTVSSSQHIPGSKPGAQVGGAM